MAGFPIGMIALLGLAALIYFGLAQRVLDRMYLNDKVAIGILAAIAIGSFINIPLFTGRMDISINVGGGLIPIGLAIYVLTRAGTPMEKWRAIGAIIATAITVFLINGLLFTDDPWQGGRDWLDPLLVYPLAAGTIAYIVGRSRRSAFISATIGVLLLDLYDAFYLGTTGTPGTVAIGGAGAFDTILLSGVVAVLLAEVMGETMERLQGGPKPEGHAPNLLRQLSDLQGHQHLAQPAKKELPKNAGDEVTDEGRRNGHAE